MYQSNVFTPLKSISIPLYIYADDDSRIFTRDVLLVKGILGKDVIYVTVTTGLQEEVEKKLVGLKEKLLLG